MAGAEQLVLGGVDRVEQARVPAGADEQALGRKIMSKRDFEWTAVRAGSTCEASAAKAMRLGIRQGHAAP
jgi:hypothetical protein